MIAALATRALRYLGAQEAPPPLAVLRSRGAGNPALLPHAGELRGDAVPVDGMPSGFEGYLQEWVDLGELDQEDVRCLDQSLRLDYSEAAFAELSARPALQPEIARARAVAQRVGF
jgi:hypothetical protein